MTASFRKRGLAFAARLERLIKRRRAVAKAAQAEAARLTPGQKTASERRLSRTCVAQPQRILTFQENNHARLL
jgi:hypothetical protein